MISCPNESSSTCWTITFFSAPHPLLLYGRRIHWQWGLFERILSMLHTPSLPAPLMKEKRHTSFHFQLRKCCFKTTTHLFSAIWLRSSVVSRQPLRELGANSLEFEECRDRCLPHSGKMRGFLCHQLRKEQSALPEFNGGKERQLEFPKGQEFIVDS